MMDRNNPDVRPWLPHSGIFVNQILPRIYALLLFFKAAPPAVFQASENLAAAVCCRCQRSQLGWIRKCHGEGKKYSWSKAQGFAGHQSEHRKAAALQTGSVLHENYLTDRFNRKFCGAGGSPAHLVHKSLLLK
jgi:hypothetical protein